MESLARTGGNACTTSGLLTATGAETVYDTTVAISYSIDGVAYAKAAVTDGATPTTDVVSGSAFDGVTADQARCYVWTLDSAGAVGLIEGEVSTVDGETDILEKKLQFPPVPGSLTPFAYMVYQTDGTASGTLRPGTDNWNATGLTVSITNVHRLPSRPVS